MFFFLFYLFLYISSIYSSIEIIKTPENFNITISCHLNLTKIKSNQLTENIILWYKNETNVIGVNSISNNPKKYFLNQINIYTYQLTIFNIQLDSSGLYKCQSFITKEEQHFQLDVLVPPSNPHLVSSLQLPVIDGSLVVFNCISERVYPNPIFEWYKNDKLIQRSIGNQTFFSSSSILTLLLTSADHNHILRCQVSNEASINITSTEIKLEILFKPIIKIFFHEKELITKNLTIIENTFDIIRCQIISNPLIISDIQWFKNDQLILGEHQEQLGMNFTEIDKLSCRAENIIGQTENNIHINLLYQPKLFMIKNLTLIQGEKLILKCFIKSNPICNQIRWLYNNKELKNESCIKEENHSEYIIENVNRSHTGKYTCEVKNQLNELSHISTDVRIQYAPIILNSYNKLAVREGEDIRTECIIDAYPKADIIWFGPSNQILNSFTQEKFLNDTIQSSILHLPLSYSSILGLYRCIAMNNIGKQEFIINFQRPGLPDPPIKLEAINITYSSFILHWQSGYNGGLEQIFQIILNDTHIEERYTNLNSIYFEDLNQQTYYMIKIRSKNQYGFSINSTNLIIQTKQSLIHSENFPLIERISYIKNTQRIRLQLNSFQSIPFDRLCVQYYNINEISSCIPLNSLKNGLEINFEKKNLRLKLCLINQTDICSKSIFIPNNIQLINYSSEWILILAGGIIGLCIVFGLLALCICIHQQKQKSKSGSTDTLKTNSDHSSVRVSDTSSSSNYYNSNNQIRTLYYNDETKGIYSITEKKTNSMCFDSGMLSTISNNSDSLALSSSDFHDRSDGEYLVNGRRINRIINEQISSEEESGFSTPTKSHRGKKLVYEVVV